MAAPVYLDHHATTPVDERVLDAMLPYFREHFGNPSSSGHRYGWRADEAVQVARSQVAALLGASTKEVHFTSGATESNNLAIKGAVRAAIAADPRCVPHVVTSSIEHKAVLDACRALEREGAQLTIVSPSETGVIDPQSVIDAVTDDTVIVSLMLANNEIGTVQPVAEVGAACRERGVLLHCDAVQGAAHLDVDVEAMGIDLLSLTAHKLYGPKGSGALYVRRGPKTRLVPLVDGGGQERGVRPGTLNVPGIVGLGAAAALAREVRDEESTRLRSLRDLLLARLREGLDELTLNGAISPRLPGNLNISFWPVEAEGLMLALSRDVALSSGSACSSASLEPSHVLKAIGVGHDRAHCSLRFGVGRFNTPTEIEYVAARVIEEVRKLRDASPAWRAAQPRMRS
ncbi:MAG: cysteine desulfurase family protein [Myxococcota bacterium]